MWRHLTGPTHPKIGFFKNLSIIITVSNWPKCITFALFRSIRNMGMTMLMCHLYQREDKWLGKTSHTQSFLLIIFFPSVFPHSPGKKKPIHKGFGDWSHQNRCFFYLSLFFSMTAGSSRSQSRFAIFLFFPLSVFHKSTHTDTDAHKPAQKQTLKCSYGKWTSADCPLRLLHYPFCVYFPFSALIFSLSSGLSLGLCSYSLCQVCASISYPYCPVSCHPFTRPSSLCHHQGPGGLLRSASGEKGLYLGNAPSNRSS